MDVPALQLFPIEAESDEPLPVRGIGWVLGWAAVLAVLTVSAAILTAFAYQFAAERALARAATAGFREATLPRATNRSIEAATRRRLADSFAVDRAVSMSVAKAGDRISLALAVPLDHVLPRWLPIGACFGSAEVSYHRVENVGHSW